MDFSTALTLIQTILQLLNSSFPFQREIESLWGYKSQLEKLQNSIIIIQAVLLEAERQQSQQLPISFPLQASLERLTKVLYDADDLFDEVATFVQRKELMSGNNASKEVRLFFSRFNQLTYAFTKSREIKKIKETLDDIATDYSKFGSMVPYQGGGETSQARRNARETGSMLCEKDVINGRDDDKRVLIDMLLNTGVEESVSCVSIVGIGGLGKTTLAQLVYNDEMIKREFQPRMWVCVSNDFDVKSLLAEILAVATNQSINHSLNMDQLQTRIQQQLQGKKYLLVLDDVWDDVSNKWETLRRPLIGSGSRGSRILVTTRLANTAHIVGGQTHKLKGLSEEESWNLFERMTLKSRHEMEALNGEKILKKCVGVPLAIRVIGSYLCGQGKSKWMHVGNTDLPSEIDKDIMPVLEISYYDLPLHLKRCFTYCAIFPKDHVIVKEELIYLWLAQGFILSDGPSLEDVGEAYFMNLLGRCFFQGVQRGYDGEIISCKMHDLIHDLAESIAGTEIALVKDNLDSLKAEAYHIFFEHQFYGPKIRFFTQMKRMRTLLVDGYISNHEISKVRNLRVLSLHHIKKLSNVIGEMIHLRYINLSGIKFRFLPPSITNLHNLQMLNLQHCNKLEKLPKDFGKLINLRCLDLLNCYSLENMPSGMRSMTCLYKLTRFVLGDIKKNILCAVGRVSMSGLEDLKCLKSIGGTLHIILRNNCIYDVAQVQEGGYIFEMEQLKRLQIEFGYLVRNNFAQALLEGLKPNSNLQMLRLDFYRGLEFPSWGMMGGLLQNLKDCLPNLVEIYLSKCYKLEHLPSMSQCPKLRVLELRHLNSLEYVESISDRDGDPMELGGSRQGEVDESVFFPSLEVLVLDNLPKLKGWWSHSNLHVFSQLNNLTIKGCKELTTFPCLKGESCHISIRESNNVEKSGILSFSGSGNELVEISSVNVGFVINSLPADVLQHRSRLAILHWSDMKRLLLVTGEVFQSGRVSPLGLLKIEKCRGLRRLSELLGKIREHLTLLKILTLWNLPELDLEEEEEAEDENSSGCSSIRELKTREEDNTTAFYKPWRFLSTLHFLYLYDLPKLVKLPTEMQHLTSLQYLDIYRCHNLEELPAWIGCYTSLLALIIRHCSKLKSLPQEMCQLTSLQYLDLSDNSKELETRCQKPSGEDSFKIQHIPRIDII